jgi:hypothetical protein
VKKELFRQTNFRQAHAPRPLLWMENSIFARLLAFIALDPRTNKPSGTDGTGLEALKKLIELKMVG